MRRFRVWCNDAHHHIVLPDDATDDACEAACADALDALIGSTCDTGWNEVDEHGEVTAQPSVKP
jgi:hypothetical protein